MGKSLFKAKRPQRIQAYRQARRNAMGSFVEDFHMEADKVGGELVHELQKRIDSGQVPGTPAKDGTTFKDSGFGRNSIQVWHEHGKNVYVGIPPGTKYSDGKEHLHGGEVTKIFFDIETGARPGWSAKPLLRQTVKDKHDELSALLNKRFFKAHFGAR